MANTNLNGGMRQANVADLDAALDAAAAERASICNEMAARPNDVDFLMPSLVAVTGRIADLQFARSERIRDTFCRR